MEWNYKKYDGLCKLMTSRRKHVNYQEVKEKIVQFLYTRALISIRDLETNPGIHVTRTESDFEFFKTGIHFYIFTIYEYN